MPLSAFARGWSLAEARDAFLLRDVERTVAAYPESLRAEVGALVRTARERASLAELALDSHVASALALYDEAALLLLRAIVAVRAPEELGPATRAEDVVPRFRALELAGAPVSPAELDGLLEDVRRADPLEAARLPTLAVVERAHAARAIVRWLGTLVEARGLAELRRDRVLRVGAASIVAVGLVAWCVSSLVTTRNVALHKTVTTSGVHELASAPPGGLTDGVISGAPYGVHTSVSAQPWVQVDLGGVYRVGTVKVYNRGDGWFNDCLPLTLQVSLDGTWFVDLETRRTGFTQKAPWVANGRREPARYVRVRGTPGKYVTLSELEVFAR